MSVVDHRPPLRRIEIGSGPADRRRQSEVTEAMSGVGPTERDRIWKLLVQASQDGIGIAPPELVVEEHLPSIGFSDESIF